MLSIFYGISRWAPLNESVSVTDVPIWEFPLTGGGCLFLFVPDVFDGWLEEVLDPLLLEGVIGILTEQSVIGNSFNFLSAPLLGGIDPVVGEMPYEDLLSPLPPSMATSPIAAF